jgi:hypothetical protein
MVSTEWWIAASTTPHPRRRACLTALMAWWALRWGRNPAEGSWTLAAKMGSMTSVHACCPTRSRSVGIPKGRGPPSGWGMCTRRTGGGRDGPARRSCLMCSTNGSTPWRSTSALVPPSLPAAPPVARPSCQARHRLAGRKRRAYRAGNRRFRLLWAAPSSRRWRGRELARGGVGPGRACPVPDLLASHRCRRGPARPSSGVVAMLAGTMASSAFAPDLRRDVTRRRIPAVPAAVGRPSDATSPVPAPTLTASRSPAAGGFVGPAFQDRGACRGLRLA